MFPRSFIQTRSSGERFFAVGQSFSPTVYPKEVSLVDPANIYFDLLKRNMRTRRRLIILAAPVRTGARHSAAETPSRRRIAGSSYVTAWPAKKDQHFPPVTRAAESGWTEDEIAQALLELARARFKEQLPSGQAAHPEQQP